MPFEKGNQRKVFAQCGCFLSISKDDSLLKKMRILNKKIVHMIDDIFLLVGFKTEMQAAKFQVVVLIICIITLLLLYSLFERFVSSLVMRITCGRTLTNALLFPSLWKTWAIAFAVPCVKDSFRTASLSGWCCR